MRRPEIVEYLRGEQLTVVEVNGWQTRGGTTFDPFVSLEHATAGASTGCAPSLGVCINGRDDLAGPLCHTLQSRCVDHNGLDVVYLIACGRANHAGEGTWEGADGNEDAWGNEVEHVNTPAEPMPNGRVETSARIHAAFARCSGFDERSVAQHREYARPLGRKTDIRGELLDAAAFRSRVGARLAGLTEDDDMPLVPSWAKRLANGRWPHFDVVDKTSTACTITATPGAPFKAGLDQIAAPTFRYGQAGGKSTVRVTGLSSSPRGVVEAPGGKIVLVCLDGSTFDVAG